MSAASGLEHLKPFLPGLESALEEFRSERDHD